jgi:hypothetical protein
VLRHDYDLLAERLLVLGMERPVAGVGKEGVLPDGPTARGAGVRTPF